MPRRSLYPTPSRDFTAFQAKQAETSAQDVAMAFLHTVWEWLAVGFGGAVGLAAAVGVAYVTKSVLVAVLMPLIIGYGVGCGARWGAGRHRRGSIAIAALTIVLSVVHIGLFEYLVGLPELAMASSVDVFAQRTFLGFAFFGAILTYRMTQNARV